MILKIVMLRKKPDQKRIQTIQFHLYGKCKLMQTDKSLINGCLQIGCKSMDYKGIQEKF
jgi:hypothetical protein